MYGYPERKEAFGDIVGRKQGALEEMELSDISIK